MTTNDGIPSLATSSADHQADQRTDGQADQHGQHPALAVADDGDGGVAGSHAAGDTGGQVDLAEQQHGDQAHRQDRDGRGLHQQVGDVQVAGEGVGAERGEDDEQHDQAEDGRQRAHVAAADAVDVGAELTHRG